MELDYFRDKLFDLLNDSEGLGIADLDVDERNRLLTVRTDSGSTFGIICRRMADGEGKWADCYGCGGKKSPQIL